LFECLHAWHAGGDLAFKRWKDGMTGQPLVDANMRELKATGMFDHMGIAVYIMSCATETLVDSDTSLLALACIHACCLNESE
jgi:hypothetical protein